MTVEATITIRPRLIPSTRFLLALLVSFAHVVLYVQRINLTMAIVCMVNRTGLYPELAGKINNITNKHTTLFFEEKQFFWNEWDQQIILGSYWCGYLLTLVPSK
jgi:hypothetical protein